MKNVLIIPAYNPDQKLLKLICDIDETKFAAIILVNDGSNDESKEIFYNAEFYGCIVCHHKTNMGKGEAIKTALRAVRKSGLKTSGAVTADCDGQHTIQDIYNISDELQKKPNSLILGERDLKSKNVPLRSKIGNKFSSLYFKADTGVQCDDTQTGLRGIPCSLFNMAINTAGSRYEYEMNFLTACAKDKVDIVSVPIKTVYNDNNSGSHFNALKDSVRIYKTPLRFMLASLICAITDLTLFTLVIKIFSFETYSLILTATVGARIVSGLLNFTINRRWSFLSKGNKNSQLVKYLLLFTGQMLVSFAAVSLLSFVPIPLTIIKIIIDSMLFVFSYFMQRNWVFKQTSSFNQSNVRK